MKRPIIGVLAKQSAPRQDDLVHRMDLVDEIRMMVLKHGGNLIMLTPTEMTFDFNQSDLGDDKILSDEEKQLLYQQIDLCDGIILQGGDYSCSYEVEAARYAIDKDVPLIGICAGFNNILRALGSNIYEDKTRKHSSRSLTYRHPIKIYDDNLLHTIIGKNDYEVNSLHEMIADEQRVKGYAKICACSEDGLIESFTLEDKKFVLAMKWHPELMADDEGANRIFISFINACKS